MLFDDIWCISHDMCINVKHVFCAKLSACFQQQGRLLASSCLSGSLPVTRQARQCLMASSKVSWNSEDPSARWPLFTIILPLRFTIITIIFTIIYHYLPLFSLTCEPTPPSVGNITQLSRWDVWRLWLQTNTAATEVVQSRKLWLVRLSSTISQLAFKWCLWLNYP